MTELLANPSIKRAAVGAIAAATIALNKRLGLGLEVSDVIALTTLAVAFLTQSAMKEVKLAGQDAAAKIDSTKAAVDLFNKVPPTTTVNVENK